VDQSPTWLTRPWGAHDQLTGMDESGGAGVGNLGWELVVVQAVKLWWRVKEVPGASGTRT
jgi:hypothetical protein